MASPRLKNLRLKSKLMIAPSSNKNLWWLYAKQLYPINLDVVLWFWVHCLQHTAASSEENIEFYLLISLFNYHVYFSFLLIVTRLSFSNEIYCVFIFTTNAVESENLRALTQHWYQSFRRNRFQCLRLKLLLQFSVILMFHFSSIFEHLFIVRWYKGVKCRRSFSNNLQ